MQVTTWTRTEPSLLRRTSLRVAKGQINQTQCRQFPFRNGNILNNLPGLKKIGLFTFRKVFANSASKNFTSKRLGTFRNENIHRGMDFRVKSIPRWSRFRAYLRLEIFHWRNWKNGKLTINIRLIFVNIPSLIWRWMQNRKNGREKFHYFYSEEWLLLCLFWVKENSYFPAVTRLKFYENLDYVVP